MTRLHHSPFTALVSYCAASLLGAVALTLPAIGYPLDGFEHTGIQRLDAYRLAQTGKIRARLLPPGARFPGDTIQLRLIELMDFAIPAPDAEFSEAIDALLQDDADAYGVAILDLTDPRNPRLAAHKAEMTQNPGSVGKLVVALGWFQALADLYPGDDESRDALLRNTYVTADRFIRHDSHEVPIWKPGDPEVEYRPLREADTANLWTWFDWMLSSSSNAAASSVMAQLILLKHFGAEYPVPLETATKFFRDTPQTSLSRIFREAVQTPVTRNGLDIDKLRQGSFFTAEGKSRIPGTNSVSTPMELLRFMLRLEQGTLVDGYSSLALKRLLYLSERRIRYASSPAFRRAAVYFKSGSLYSCQPEKGFECGKYRGNVLNYLNSVISVETEVSARSLHYIAVVLSNVLRKDSAEVHKNLATEIHAVIDAYHAGARTHTEMEDAGSAINAESASDLDVIVPIDEIDADEIDEIDGED